MIRIEITEEFVSKEELLDALNQIATMVQRGFTSGYGPNWRVEGEELKSIE